MAYDSPAASKPAAQPARNRLLRGSDEPSTALRPLRAGALTTLLDGADLRYVRLGGIELVRRIYVAVRDRSWNTIPATIENLHVDEADDGFEVRFRARHASDDIAFAWDGSITGDPSGRIGYSLEGRFEGDATYGRVGICVHHPWRETAGRPFAAHTPDGDIQGTFPTLIGPQLFVDGTFRALFDAFDRLELELEHGASLSFEFEGDLWETEDHRNWTDANFKTYSTPLSLGPPPPAAAGDSLRQRVVVTPAGVTRAPPGEERVRLTVGPETGTRVPAIGIAADSDGHRPDDRELSLLRALAPRHLRVEVRLGEAEWTSGLASMQETAVQIAAPLEVALLLRPEHAGELPALADALAMGPPAERFLITLAGGRRAPDETTPPDLVDLVRQTLAGVATGAAFVGGTELYFTEINRTRPQVETWDGVCYSITPQIHAFADVDLIENLDVQGETIRSALALSGGKPVIVSPITIRRRANFHAEGDPRPTPLGELPDSVDVRQSSLLGAAWTASSLKYVSEAGAASVTYYESTGWRGVVERSSGSPLPEQFHSRPATAFPLYHPLADVAGWEGAAVMRVDSDDPLRAVAMCARTTESAMRLLVANLTPEEQAVAVGPLDGRLALRRLNEATAEQAMADPIAFRVATELQQPQGQLALQLAPYEVVRIDPA